MIFRNRRGFKSQQNTGRRGQHIIFRTYQYINFQQIIVSINQVNKHGKNVLFLSSHYFYSNISVTH